VRSELLAASDDAIADAIEYADPMVLRGLVFQLTGDQALMQGSLTLSTGVRGGSAAKLTDASDIAAIRARAARFMREYRDGGGGDIAIGDSNAAFDGRLMWSWLRDPARSEVEAGHLEEHLREASRIIGPFFGKDLILS
jgi:hypothetical protein